jgi:radical SAM-linked protein
VTWWLLTFSRRGPASYLSHLDTARALQRTFARAGVPIAPSQGMRPKPRLSLPLPLPVGASGCHEVAVIEVAGNEPDLAAALRGLRAAAPPGLEPGAILLAGERRPRPGPREAEYTCLVDGDAGDLAAAVEGYAEEQHVIYERVSPKGRRTLDLKEYVVDAAAEAVTGGARIRFTIRHRAGGAARPKEFVDLIAHRAGVGSAMRGLERVRIAWEGLPPGRDLEDGRRVSCDNAQEGGADRRAGCDAC